MFNNDKTSDNSLNPFKGEDIKENIEDVISCFDVIGNVAS